MKQRQANFELLRIFAMFLIVVWHIKGHYMKDFDAIQPIVSKVMNLTTDIISFHVDLFILITGYFGIRSNKKAIVKNMLLCGLYLWSFNTISFFAAGNINICEILFPISHSPWWFMTVYFMLLLVAPFMEKIFSLLDCKEWGKWLATVLVINVYFGHFHHVGSVYLMGFNLVNMITLYSIGAFIRTHAQIVTAKSGGVKRLVLLFVMLVVIRVVAGKVCYYCDLDFMPGEYCSPYIIALAVNVFLIFMKMRVSANKFISFFSSSAVSVYLISEYPVIRNLLTNVFKDIYSDYC